MGTELVSAFVNTILYKCNIFSAFVFKISITRNHSYQKYALELLIFVTIGVSICIRISFYWNGLFQQFAIEIPDIENRFSYSRLSCIILTTGSLPLKNLIAVNVSEFDFCITSL